MCVVSVCGDYVHGFRIDDLGWEGYNNRPRLLTPIVGVNNRHKSAIDTDSVSIIATNRLLTPTNDSFHLSSAEMRRRGTHASPAGLPLRWFRADQTSRSATTCFCWHGQRTDEIHNGMQECSGSIRCYRTGLGLAIPTPARNGFRTETTLSHRCLHNMYMGMQVNKNK